jgi:hypothetical protein
MRLDQTLDQIDRTGFAPRHHVRAQGHRSTVLAQLITSAALAVSIAIAATAVSIGIARADGLATAADDPGACTAVAMVLALSSLGGIAASLSIARVRSGARR